MVLSCQNVTKAFGDDVIFSKINFQVNDYEKVAIVGANGAGKSTLLKVIVGEMNPDDGIVVFGKDKTFGYLAQYQNQNNEGTIYDIVLNAKPQLLAAEANLRSLENQMAKTSGDELEKLMNTYHQKTDEFIRDGGESYRSEVAGVLKGLGFSESEFDKTTNQLSGGQLTRVYLAKLLITKPDLLILDEPINHLDLKAIEWLENYLLNYKSAVIIVAHDRYFLDRVCDHVLDLVFSQGFYYKGNYSAFIEQKEQRMITLLHEYENQQKMIAHQEEVIEKLKSFNRQKSVKRAESRQKMLDKIDRIDKPIEENTSMRLTLEPDLVSGKDVLSISGLSKSYDGQSLFSNVDIELHRGEKLAILGDNGTGKTTLLKIINDKVDADSGVVKIGSNVTIAYYDQAQQELDDNKTLFEEMADAYPDLTQTKIRNVLAAFLFTGDDPFKKISMLSGGERGRVSLAKLMLSGANLLILDEPTNHLDMESKEILENALNSFTGTCIYVSHDRYFVNQTCDRILNLENNSFTEYLGNYDYYLEKKEQLSANSSLESNFASMNVSSAKESDSKDDWKKQKERVAKQRKIENAINAAEAEIERLEDEIAKIDAKFDDPLIMHNSAKLNELTSKQNSLKEELDNQMRIWEEKSVELDNLQ